MWTFNWVKFSLSIHTLTYIIYFHSVIFEYFTPLVSFTLEIKVRLSVCEIKQPSQHLYKTHQKPFHSLVSHKSYLGKWNFVLFIYGVTSNTTARLCVTGNAGFIVMVMWWRQRSHAEFLMKLSHAALDVHYESRANRHSDGHIQHPPTTPRELHAKWWASAFLLLQSV